MHMHTHTHTHTHTHLHTHGHVHLQNTEAVLYGYEKQQDNQLSLKMGDIITDVKQVCAVI